MGGKDLPNFRFKLFKKVKYIRLINLILGVILIFDFYVNMVEISLTICMNIIKYNIPVSLIINLFSTTTTKRFF